MFNIHNHS
jgi:hypothetical protein